LLIQTRGFASEAFIASNGVHFQLDLSRSNHPHWICMH